MREITTVFTMRKEAGLCTVNGLLEILEAFAPEVIFEEMSETDFSALARNPSSHTLEMQAIAQYEKAWEVRQMRVDNVPASERLAKDMDKLFEFVENDSVRYLPSITLQKRQAIQLGYSYLCSMEFDELSKIANEEMERSVATSNSDILRATLSNWHEIQRKRVHSMLENIFAYCREYQFEKGAFLVGAEHRWPILNGIKGSHGAGDGLNQLESLDWSPLNAWRRQG